MNIDKLAEQLSSPALPWGEHPERQCSPGSPHADMRDLWVRYNTPDKIGPHFNDEHDSAWYPVAYKIPAVFGLAFNLMAEVQAERLGGILITRLPAGGEIKAHVDTGWHAGYYDKFLIPIQNDPGASFWWDDFKIEPEPGEVWWFENNIPHGVSNHSHRDRIALIVCIRTLCRSIHEDGFRAAYRPTQRSRYAVG